MLLIQTRISDTVQIRSRHGCHSVTYPDSPQLRDAPDTDAILFLIQLRDAPDTDAILLLIQIQHLDTAWIHSRYGCYSFDHSDLVPRYNTDTFQIRIPFWYSFFWLTTQQTFLDGIYKPISNKILWLLQMASLSPFPQLHFNECKFTGTLVSNHLLPLSHERQNSSI